MLLKKIIFAIIGISILFLGFLTYQSTKAPNESDIHNSEKLPPPVQGALITPWQKTSFTPIPSDAEVIFHRDGYAFTATKEGKEVTQITHGEKRDYEHLAVSPDRRYIVSDINPHADRSKFNLWIYDLQNNTEAQLVPDYFVAGDGGVDWDKNGFVYFKCKKEKKTEQADLCKIKYDGTKFQQLTNTPNVGETDVSVSEDGSLLVYALFVPEPARNKAHTEIWTMNAEGGGEKLVYTAGDVFKGSAHDPELSPDNSHVIFSMVDSTVPPNYANIPAANTAHNIYSVKMDGSDLQRLTVPGPISILPDWKGNDVIYTEISEKDKYNGACIIPAGKTDQSCKEIAKDASAFKFIP